MQLYKIGIMMVAVVLVGAGCASTEQTTEPAVNEEGIVAETEQLGMPVADDTQTDESIVVDVVTEVLDDSQTEPTQADEPTSAGPGVYEKYSADKLARANDGTVVLAFLADWCPSCRAIDKSITAQLSSIPAGLSILELDYDKENELKKKYGVTSQHTFVQVDAQGKLIQKWTGGNTLESIVTKVSS